jgi:hypothetical protein
VISVDGSLQQVPFELLEQPSAQGRRLLETHVVSYTPSASILMMLRTRADGLETSRIALAVGASPPGAVGTSGTASGPVTRSVYDLDARNCARCHWQRRRPTQCELLSARERPRS